MAEPARSLARLWWNDVPGARVVLFAAAVLLAALSVAAFPCWSYSRRWGYGPSVTAGALLLVMAMMAITNKATPKVVASTPDSVEVAGR